jgi:hypothetical protein
VTPDFGGQLWDAQAAVTAGLQVAAQVREAERTGVLFQVAGWAVVDREPAVDD